MNHDLSNEKMKKFLMFKWDIIKEKRRMWTEEFKNKNVTITRYTEFSKKLLVFLTLQKIYNRYVTKTATLQKFKRVVNSAFTVCKALRKRSN